MDKCDSCFEIARDAASRGLDRENVTARRWINLVIHSSRLTSLFSADLADFNMSLSHSTAADTSENTSEYGANFARARANDGGVAAAQ